MGASDTAQKHAQILSQHVCMPGSWEDTIRDLAKCTCHLDDSRYLSEHDFPSYWSSYNSLCIF